MKHSIVVFLLVAILAFPIGQVWGSANAATIVHIADARAAKAKKYRGPAVGMRWGPVQVIITVKGKKITNVAAAAPIDRPRSAFINDQALPLLKQEVLQAQSATVGIISGATMTSNAYIRSLQAAIKKAHL